MTLNGVLPALGIDADQWARPLETACSLYDIHDRRAQYFVAQCCHESQGFTRLVENLDYSAKRLREVFPKYFTEAEAKRYERKPSSIGARVYANRLGNGNEASGEGWLYCGRGLIQLTGKANYRACGLGIGYDLVANPKLLSEDETAAALSAAWFWATHGCNELADAGNFTGTTRRINGGLTGQEDRLRWLVKVQKATKGES